MVVEVTVSVVVVVVEVAAIVVVGSSSSSKIVKYYLFFFLIFYLYEVFVTRFIQFLSFISPTVVIWNAQCEGNHFFDQFRNFGISASKNATDIKLLLLEIR